MLSAVPATSEKVVNENFEKCQTGVMTRPCANRIGGYGAPRPG